MEQGIMAVGWHAEKKWVTLRPADQKDVQFAPNNLTEAEQKLYFKGGE